MNSERLRYVAGVLLLALACFAAGRLSLSVALIERGGLRSVTPVWVPAGISLAALLLFGRRFWPGILLGIFLSSLTTGKPAWMALWMASGNALGALLALYLLRRLTDFDPTLNRVADVLNFVLIAVVLSPVADATMGVASLIAGGIIAWPDAASVWWVWWLGDAIGVLLAATVLLTWLPQPPPQWTRKRKVEAGTLLASLIVVSQSLYGGWLAADLARTVTYTVFPFTIWAALRFGQRGAVTANAVVAGLAIWGTANDLGPFAIGPVHVGLLFLHGFIAANAVTTMLLAVAVSERERAQDELRRRHRQQVRAREAVRRERDRAQEYLDIVEVMLVALDEEGAITLLNRRGYEILGYEEGELAGKNWFDTCLPARLRNEVSSVFRNIMSGNMDEAVQYYENPVVTKSGAERIVAWHNALLRDEAGSIAGTLGSGLDITERVRAEEELREYREHLEELVAERTAALNQRVAEVEQLNQGMANMLENLRTANRQLDESAHRLEVANAELEAFAYSVSHDLRAPLRSISGFAQIIARRHRDDLNEEGRHYFDNIVEASQHMSRLIDDLLRYSRLGRKAVRRQPVPLGDVMDQALDNLAEAIGTTDARLDVPADLPVVAGDPTLLQQTFTNLLDNALTYHAPDVAPAITVDWETENDHVTVRVADEGIGIPAEYQDKIFKLFQRLHSQDDYAGTGIGLAIVKKAAELLGGRVWVESKEGEGATFFVRLPVDSEQ